MYTHSNPVPQRAHKKSTNGCLACKQRKVKCDEKRPICGKCAIHFANIKSCEWKAPKNTKKCSKVKNGPPWSVPQSQVHTLAAENSSAYNALFASLNDREKIDTNELKAPASQKKSQSITPNTTQCRCPCHVPQYTNMMLDVVFGICRICGNLPSLGYPTTSCTPVVPSSILMRNQIDPFHILPVESSNKVLKLIHHWINTLALFPTSIHTEYCTNPTWLSTAISNAALFNVTLYICSVHIDGLRGMRESADSLLYKANLIMGLNEILKDPTKATSDETISAVLLLGNILSIIGEPNEVAAHLNGLRLMINLRGGIGKFSIDGCFLHMLCTTNHLSAVLSETNSLIPPSGITYPQASCNLASPPPLSSTSRSSFSYLSDGLIERNSASSLVNQSPLLKAFAISSGWNETVVDLFYDLGYLYAVLDAFTLRLVPALRTKLLDLAESIECGDGVFEDPNPLRLSPSQLAGSTGERVLVKH